MTKIFGISTSTWIAVVICIGIPAPGFALKCYVCNSLYNESCDELEDGQQYLSDCSIIDMEKGKNHTNCRTEVFSAYSVAFEMYTHRTVRSCGYETHPRLTCFSSSNTDLKGTTCECFEDACNASNMLHFICKSLLLVVLCGFMASLLAT